MYSAIRVEGKHLYERARQGEEVERAPRQVTIDSITILDWAPPDLALDVTCSSGTYIRSLAHDIGQELGCGGHLSALRRIASGPFTLERGWTLGDLEQLQTTGRFSEALLPATAALGSMPAILVSADDERAIRFGQTIEVTLSQVALPEPPDLLQARDAGGDLIAVLRHLASFAYQPAVVLPPDAA
jgi:tRNA pseudouridine55 synthase